MQDLLQKRAQTEASMAYNRDPAILAEEDNFDVTSSEEPTPRRPTHRAFAANEHTEMTTPVENGRGNGYAGRPVVETDV